MGWVTDSALPLLLGCLASAAIYVFVKKQGDDWRANFSSRRGERAFDLAFVIMAFIVFFVYALLDLGKFQAFKVYGVDFALFDQVIWNTLRGRLFENTVFADAPILLAQRFSPILFASVPLYAFFSDPRILVVIPAAAVTLAAFPLYWFARRRIGRALALAIAFAFLTAPGLQYIALDQFKEIMLAIPFLMFATTFLLLRKYLPFLGALVLALLCKEEVGLIAAAFGAYIFFVHRRYVLGGALGAFGLAWVFFLIQVVIPYFQGSSTYFYFGGSATYGSEIYNYLGGSLPEMIVTVVRRPDIVMQNVLTVEKADAAIKVLLPPWNGRSLGAGCVTVGTATTRLHPVEQSTAAVPVWIVPLFSGLCLSLRGTRPWSGTTFAVAAMAFQVLVQHGRGCGCRRVYCGFKHGQLLFERRWTICQRVQPGSLYAHRARPDGRGISE